MALLIAGNVVKIFVTPFVLIFFNLPFGILVLISVTVLIPIVKLLASLFRPDLSEIFVERGNVFANDDIYTHPKINVIVHVILRGELTLELLRSQFEQRVLNHKDDKGVLVYRRLRQTWTQFCGYLFWKWDEDFNICNHVRLYDYKAPHLRLPNPCSEKDINRVTAGLLEQPYMKGTSPWELLLVRGYQCSGDERQHCMMTLKINHAMADGYSILKLITHLFEAQSVKVAVPTHPKLSLWQSFIHKLSTIISFPYICTKLYFNYRDGRNALHPGGQLSKNHVTFFSDKIPVNQIKEIKNRHNTSYNAAVYSIICGGIIRLMREAGMEIPQGMSSFVPFPLPGHPGGLVNHAVGAYFKFCPQTEGAVERLQEISANFQNVAAAPLDPVVISWIGLAISLIPFPISRYFHTLATESTLVLTSVPGPENVVEWQGMVAKDIIIAMGTPTGNIGAVGAMFSSMGYQRMGITVDKTILEGHRIPTNFNELINIEVEELLGVQGASDQLTFYSMTSSKAAAIVFLTCRGNFEAKIFELNVTASCTVGSSTKIVQSTSVTMSAPNYILIP